MNYTVYVIKNSQSKLYKGITTNLEKRIRYHNSNFGEWTKNKGPWNLVYKERFTNKTEALKREKFFKTGKGREFLKKIVE